MHANKYSKRDAPGAPRSCQDAAALQGATLAFGGRPRPLPHHAWHPPPTKSKAPLNVTVSSGSTSAGAATTIVDTQARPSSRLRSMRSMSQEGHLISEPRNINARNSVEFDHNDMGKGIVRKRRSLFDQDRHNRRQRPDIRADLTKSSPLIAANLAASRSLPASPNHTGQPASLESLERQSRSARLLPPTATDGRTRLESKSLYGLESMQSRPLVSATAETTSRPAVQGTAAKPRPTITRPAQTELLPHDTLRVRDGNANNIMAEPRQSRASVVPTPVIAQDMTSGPKQTGFLEHIPSPSTLPSSTGRSMPSGPTSSPRVDDDESASSDDSFKSASSYKPSFRAALANRRSMSKSTLDSVDSLANAIVASSLASSRNASPARSPALSWIHPPPPPPSRRHLFHSNEHASRTPSPSKPSGFRTTMRKPKGDEDEEEWGNRRGKKHIMKKHRHKHHEGDRKRWRDVVTERERKRYEAVWASNKGLYNMTVLPSLEGTPQVIPGSELTICNLVAQDIFERSRLHRDNLEEVYELIDRRKVGSLSKEEFVVGLWLIDQRLKGRKLPIRVSDSVWRSVGVLASSKVKRAGKTE